MLQYFYVFMKGVMPMHLLRRPTAIVLAVTTALCLMPAQSVMAASVDDFVARAVAIAEDDTYGYSQTDRWGPDYDCSSFVITALRQAGFDTADANNSSDMVAELTTVGFTYISASEIDMSVGSSDLQAGDILLASGHVEIYIGSNQRVGAHRDYDGVSGDSTGEEINIKAYYRGDWYGILRYTGTSTAAVSTATAVSTTTASAASTAAQTVKTASTGKQYKKGTYKTKCAVYVRAGASTSKKVRFTLKKGAKFKVVKVKKSGWGKIKYKGKTGWVYLSNCKRVK